MELSGFIRRLTYLLGRREGEGEGEGGRAADCGLNWSTEGVGCLCLPPLPPSPPASAEMDGWNVTSEPSSAGRGWHGRQVEAGTRRRWWKEGGESFVTIPTQFR